MSAQPSTAQPTIPTFSLTTLRAALADLKAQEPERNGRWDRAAIEARVNELASLLGLGHLLDRKPFGLSGGESQRVSLGRALASRPKVLLLDEPLSALDDETRVEMRELLRSVRERTGVTALHVTHHLSDAQKLADRIFILKGGAVLQMAAEFG